MSAKIVDLAERRRVRELADALADLAKGRVDELVLLQQLMDEHPGLAHELVRQVLAGERSLGEAAGIARRWFLA